jgi:hypothetical protein
MASQNVLVVTALVLSGFACTALAQDDYPNRPLRIVVGFTRVALVASEIALYTRIARAANITSP